MPVKCPACDKDFPLSKIVMATNPWSLTCPSCSQGVRIAGAAQIVAIVLIAGALGFGVWMASNAAEQRDVWIPILLGFTAVNVVVGVPVFVGTLVAAGSLKKRG